MDDILYRIYYRLREYGYNNVMAVTTCNGYRLIRGGTHF